MAEATLNLPSLLLFLGIAFFTIRYFFSGSSSASTRRRRAVVDPAQIDHVAQMFPQLSRRDIQWDLQRNGGSVQATTERVLSGRGLEAPPPSFQPSQPLPSFQPASTFSSPPKPSHPDLITRYNLKSKLSVPPIPIEEDKAGAPKAQAWSQNKLERQALLQKRREEMVLNARRKMEERERGKK
ncbi:MAG: hypothetical protein LQ351_003841 [Letrouitia transgressa]|nr:MAG: hypothetical protein LQ351_003841 [Letrouitia transgressa]